MRSRSRTSDATGRQLLTDWDRSPSSPEGFPASLAPALVDARGRVIPAGSGRTCEMPSWLLDLLGFLGRTCQDYAQRGPTTCSPTWKMQVTPRGRLWLVLRMPEPCTDESESGSSQSERWCTVKASDAYRGSNPRPGARGDLNAQVKMWPTPRVYDVENRATTEHRGCLSGIVQMWPTVTARDCRSLHTSASLTNSRPLSEVVGSCRPDPNSTNGRQAELLNPEWAAQLMEWPPEFIQSLAESFCGQLATDGTLLSHYRSANGSHGKRQGESTGLPPGGQYPNLDISD